MLLFLKKKNDNAPKEDIAPVSKSSSAHGNIHEFIPYDCHITPHTLLTKNGELLQTIKIASNTMGLDYEGGNTDPHLANINVREIIRRALMHNISSEKFSFWIHTMRKRKPISYSTPVAGGFDAYVHEKWQQKNSWKYQYYNEVYVTILRDGQSSDLIDQKHMAQVILPHKNREFRNSYLDQISIELDAIVTSIMDEIRPHYNVQRLAITERIPDQSEIELSQPIFYSELMEFISSVLNMQPCTCPLPELDLSEALATHAITFGFNALETKDTAGKRRFGAVLTLKQYRELTPDTVDRILQAPIEFIITQSFSFIPAAEALKPFQEQREIFEISGEEECLVASGLHELFKSHKNNPTDFCQYQTTIAIMVDEYKLLDAEIARLQAIFSKIGQL